MYKINENYTKLPGSYLFSTIAKKVKSYTESHPEADIIRLGIGDVTQPLVPAVIQALHEAVDEMGRAESFRGYAPDLGYDFLRKAIADSYQEMGCEVHEDEVFVSDGAKSDCGNIQEIFSEDCRIAVCDPVYPVYVDSNVMAGRTGTYDAETGMWSEVIYMPCTSENGFVPALPEGKGADLIYLCNPNNPTGTTLNRNQLAEWVRFAKETGAVLLYDAAYEAYISEEEVPHSIYEIDGARDCAIEFRSFSKNAGFTGVRLGFTVVPKNLMSGEVSLNALWARRHGTKFNGAPYIQQKAGAAVFTKEAQEQIREQVAYYMENASIIRRGLEEAGYEVYGGVNAPYIWLKVPAGMTAWDFFDYLLEEANVVGTPGSGFGPSGEGYFRLTAFGTKENTMRAIARLKELKKR